MSNEQRRGGDGGGRGYGGQERFASMNTDHGSLINTDNTENTDITDDGADSPQR